MRPSIENYFLNMATLVSTRGTCVRRQVGCVLVNERKHVIGTGYNGPPSGASHCSESDPCPGAREPSGTGLDLCEAVHAEANALIQCTNVYSIDTCYTTVAPCIHCVKLLISTSCQRIVFELNYPHSERSKGIWINAGRSWEQYSL